MKRVCLALSLLVFVTACSKANPTGPTSTPTPSVATTGASSLFYTGLTDPVLAVATTADGKQVIFKGTKQSDGLPAAVSEVIVDAQDPSRRIFVTYDADGRAVRLASNDGGEAQVTWSNQGSPSVTFFSADGRTTFSSTGNGPSGIAALAGSPLDGAPRLTDNDRADICGAAAEGLYVVCQQNQFLAAMLPGACAAAAAATAIMAPSTFAVCAWGGTALIAICKAIAQTGDAVGGENVSAELAKGCQWFLAKLTDSPPPTPTAPPRTNVLVGAHSIFGHVKDTSDNPIANAVVSLSEPNLGALPAPPNPGTVNSDATGFYYKSIPEQSMSWVVTATAEGYLPSSISVGTTTPTTVNFALKVKPAAPTPPPAPTPAPTPAPPPTPTPGPAPAADFQVTPQMASVGEIGRCGGTGFATFTVTAPANVSWTIPGVPLTFSILDDLTWTVTVSRSSGTGSGTVTATMTVLAGPDRCGPWQRDLDFPTPIQFVPSSGSPVTVFVYFVDFQP